MDAILQNAIIAEIMYQVSARKNMAHDRRDEYNGNDPIKSLPLTEYLKGLIDGRLETWEFIEKMIPEVVKSVIEGVSSSDGD